MRRTILLLAVVTLAAAISVPAATAGSSAPLRFHESITCDETACWVGTISGDLNGAIRFDPDPDPAHHCFDSGVVGHFCEAFTIEPDSGGYIRGVDWGVYVLETGMYSARGWVTEASEEWEYLIGYKFHEQGWTTDVNTLPILGEAEAFLAKAKG